MAFTNQKRSLINTDLEEASERLQVRWFNQSSRTIICFYCIHMYYCYRSDGVTVLHVQSFVFIVFNCIIVKLSSGVVKVYILLITQNALALCALIFSWLSDAYMSRDCRIWLVFGSYSILKGKHPTNVCLHQWVSVLILFLWWRPRCSIISKNELVITYCVIIGKKLIMK